LIEVGFNSLMEDIGKAIDAVGVAAIVLGVTFAATAFVKRGVLDPPAPDNYRQFRETLGRSILLGLELLVAGDIVRTVAATPTFQSVGILVVIVLVRTFLSFSLEVEVTGRWPWDRQSSP
jgi:Predicted membrane protein